MVDQQTGLFDVVIDDDPELEAALASAYELADAVKRSRKAKKMIKDRLGDIEVKAGDRVRVGAWHYTVRDFKGGGFPIGEWAGKGATKIAPVSDG